MPRGAAAAFIRIAIQQKSRRAQFDPRCRVGLIHNARQCTRCQAVRVQAHAFEERIHVGPAEVHHAAPVDRAAGRAYERRRRGEQRVRIPEQRLGAGLGIEELHAMIKRVVAQCRASAVLRRSRHRQHVEDWQLGGEQLRADRRRVVRILRDQVVRRAFFGEQYSDDARRLRYAAAAYADKKISVRRSRGRGRGEHRGQR